MALKKAELNTLDLKVGDKIWVKVGTECDEERNKQRKMSKAIVVGLYPRWFRVRFDYKGGSFYVGMNYISCYCNGKLIYERVV